MPRQVDQQHSSSRAQGRVRGGAQRGREPGARGGARVAVELVDVSIGITNFRRLVLGCMDSYDSEQRRILQHFSKSTRFASFCTGLISEILQICVKMLLIFPEILQKKIAKFGKHPRKSGHLRGKFAKNLQILRLARCKRMQIL